MFSAAVFSACSTLDCYYCSRSVVAWQLVEQPAQLQQLPRPPATSPNCRKTLRLYLACLSDAAMFLDGGAQQGEAGQPLPLDTLQAAATYLASPPAATKAWEGSGKLAR